MHLYYLRTHFPCLGIFWAYVVIGHLSTSWNLHSQLRWVSCDASHWLWPESSNKPSTCYWSCLPWWQYLVGFSFWFSTFSFWPWLLPRKMRTRRNCWSNHWELVRMDPSPMRQFGSFFGRWMVFSLMKFPWFVYYETNSKSQTIV